MRLVSPRVPKEGAMDPNKWPSQKKEAGGYNFGTTGFGTGWQRQFLVSEAKGAAGAWRFHGCLCSCPSACFAAAAAPHARARSDAAAGTCHASAIVQPTGQPQPAMQERSATWVCCKLTNTLTSGARASCITLRSSSSFQVSSARASSRVRTAGSLCLVACMHACLQVIVPLQLTGGEHVGGNQE